MTAERKLGLADEIFSSQPNLLGAVLALRSLGVRAAKQEFALEMLFPCYQAMKEIGSDVAPDHAERVGESDAPPHR